MLAALALTLPLAAQQQPPATEVYLANLSSGAQPTVSRAVNISRSPGYDNQPSFLPDGSALLFTSQRDGKQTDIYRYDLAAGKVVQLTHTPESEYSPLVTPDGRGFSVIRVEADGTQRLWRFDLNGSRPELILDRIKPVGYQAWVDPTHVALFVLGAGNEPATLQYADTTSGRADVVDTGIGRALVMRPGTRTLTYVSKPAAGPWMVKTFDPATREVASLVATIPGSEDLTWDPESGALLMGKGTKIFGWWPQSTGWRELGDLSASGLDRITRLAVNPNPRASGNRLAVVAEPVSK